ncbi:Flp pilus assembly complex ATPase component TadA [Candidatus Pacearchaeota archaeon]|nr:Flp pilus assembly complex ATPase component TadA [Candidatus Pacearchaeota archaeon]
MDIAINVNPTIPALPRVEDKKKVDVRYMLIAPYASAHIYWDNKINELVYDIEEPILNEIEKRALNNLENAMLELINVNVAVEKSTEAITEYIDKTARLLIDELNIKIGEETYKKIFYYLFRDFIGFNEIDPLLRDYFIEDIECNGVDTPVYVIHRIYRNLRTSYTPNNIDQLASFVEKLAQRAGRYISYAQPLLDGTLPDGSRVNATYTKDVTSRGPTFTIRKFTKIPWTPTQLISMGTLSPEMLAYFWILLQYKSSILISGGTASGKTTLLNGIAFFIPPEARVVSIEDSVAGDSKLIIKEKKNIRNITIKEFVDKKIEAEVLTIDKGGKITWARPSDYIKHKVKKDIYEVTTATGRKIKVTQDHSLFALDDKNNLREIKPTELKEKESFIAVPRLLPIEGENVKEINLMNYLKVFEEDFLEGEPIGEMLKNYDYHKLDIAKERARWWKNNNIIKIKEFIRLNKNFDYEDLKKLKIKSKNKASVPILFDINKDFLEFCGLWLGDGSYDNYNKNSVIISNVDRECIDIFKRISCYLGSNYSAMNDGGVSLRIHNSVFYKFMKYVLKLDGYSNTKKIPEFIFSLSNEQIKHFIRGYFSADGCVKKYEVSCASQSYELLQDLQSMFLRLGIISRINDFERKDKCMNMSISSHDNIDLFKKIGFLQERKNILLNSMIFRAHHANSDIIPLSAEKMIELNTISNVKLQNNYLNGSQNIGRNYVQAIAPIGSEFNDLSHNDILWDRIKKIEKIVSEETEVFDLSIPKYEKFLCNNIFVHNTREINLPRENWLPSVARTSIGIGKVGEIDLFALLKASFRQNPDYLIVGEVRGKEASVMFQGMASGHSSLSTMHADSVDTLIRRLQTPPIELSPTLVNSLDCVAIATHATVGKIETRKLREIVEIINISRDGTALINTPFKWDPAKDVFYYKRQSKVFEKIAMRTGIPVEKLQAELTIRAKILYEMYKKKIFGFTEVQKVINDYFKNPMSVLTKFGIQE